MPEQHEIIPEEETSLWDYFVSKIKFWNRSEPEPIPPDDDVQPVEKRPFSWLSLAALVLALIAQLTLEPSPARTPWPGIILYFAALVCLILAIIRKEWHFLPLRSESDNTLKFTFRPEFLLMGIFFAIFAFLLFGTGLFGLLNTSLWILSLVFIFVAFWQPEKKRGWDIKAFWRDFQSKGWKIRITRWRVILLAAIVVILFFNFYRLDSVPPEMVSDQAEKLIDIHELMNGNTPVYFPRNTGREALHFYLTAAYIALFNVDVSFLSLKVVAVFANLLTIFFIYLLGKEFGNKWVGLAAALFAGIAYWPLLFTRLALRIPYYPLFVAPVLYFLIRGLRRQKINDILWAGLFLGLGLHGYTPFRILPIFVVIGILIYILHRPGRDRRLGAILTLSLIAFISLIVFVPLFRYWLANPELFAYRAFSRLTGMEVGFQNHPLVVFFQNFWKASVMFFWDNGSIWAHSVPGRPALEVVSGALYFLGITGLLIRYIKQRDWRDLFLLVSIPFLLMPSILSLAYPGENPCLNRTAGAVVPVFVVIGSALEAIIRSLRRSLPNRMGKMVVFMVVILLVIWSGVNNYDLVFNQYYNIYRASSWNTSEIGRVAAFFIESLGSPDTTYVVGYPHWVDSRLVAINAGYPGLDFAIFPEQLEDIAEDLRPKVFFLNVNDTESMKQLIDIYDKGTLTRYDSDVENKDFMIFFVPPAQGATP